MTPISRALSALLVTAISLANPAFAEDSSASSTASTDATTNEGPAYGPELQGFDYPYPESHF
jgi:hypothetical protein